MRVLIAALNSVGGVAEALAAREGVEVSCLHAARVDLGDFGISAPPAPAAGAPYTLHTLPVFPQRPYPYSLYRGGPARVLRQVQPDVIYLLGEPSELSVAQLVRAAGRACPRAGLALFSYENVVRTWRGFPRCLRGRAERYVLPRLDRVLACSHSAQAALEAQGLRPERVRVVPHGFSPAGLEHTPDPALRRELGAEGCFLVGYVGRLVPEKGVDLLLEALAALPPHFMLAVVGSGRAGEQLRERSRSLGLGERVLWLGRFERPQLPRFLSTLDALVLPSRSIPQWQEQYGAVLVEAMLCETAVVGSSSGAIPEVIGDTGLVFPEGNAGALAECLRRLADDPALRRELTAAGRPRALREFSLDTYLTRLLAVFGEIVVERSG